MTKRKTFFNNRDYRTTNIMVMKIEQFTRNRRFGFEVKKSRKDNGFFKVRQFEAFVVYPCEIKKKKQSVSTSIHDEKVLTK